MGQVAFLGLKSGFHLNQLQFTYSFKTTTQDGCAVSILASKEVFTKT